MERWLFLEEERWFGNCLHETRKKEWLHFSYYGGFAGLFLQKQPLFLFRGFGAYSRKYLSLFHRNIGAFRELPKDYIKVFVLGFASFGYNYKA